MADENVVFPLVRTVNLQTDPTKPPLQACHPYFYIAYYTLSPGLEEGATIAPMLTHCRPITAKCNDGYGRLFGPPLSEDYDSARVPKNTEKNTAFVLVNTSFEQCVRRALCGLEMLVLDKHHHPVQWPEKMREVNPFRGHFRSVGPTSITPLMTDQIREESFSPDYFAATIMDGVPCSIPAIRAFPRGSLGVPPEICRSIIETCHSIIRAAPPGDRWSLKLPNLDVLLNSL